MRDSVANKQEPLIVMDDYHTNVNTTHDTSFTESEPLITLDELLAQEEKRLMRKLLIMIIVVNLLALVSIILCS
jgi:hypothetical protein